MACSKQITIENLSKWAKIKGIDVLGTADFTHPKWFNELKSNLTETENGIYEHNSQKYIFQTEVSNIFTKNNKLRKVHNVILSPSIDIAEQITEFFSKKGKLELDGRPTFGNYSLEDMVYDLRQISKDIEVIPAHIWTPWFGVLGSKSGFDSLKEAYGDQEKYINAIETGLSSDPEMNSKIPFLKDKAFVSFSDSHSFWPWRLGREATILNIPENFTYKDIINKIRNKEINSTLEVNPSYGIYHYDGHRNCHISFHPEETKKYHNICPVCKKPLTIGVLNRVLSLSNTKTHRIQKYYEILPLHELLKLYLNTKSLTTKKIWEIYNYLINKHKNEFNILLFEDIKRIYESLEQINHKPLAEIINKNRQSKIKVIPGYDGVYGQPLLEDKNIKTIKEKQKSLNSF